LTDADVDDRPPPCSTMTGIVASRARVGERSSSPHRPFELLVAGRQNPRGAGGRLPRLLTSTSMRPYSSIARVTSRPGPFRRRQVDRGRRAPRRGRRGRPCSARPRPRGRPRRRARGSPEADAPARSFHDRDLVPSSRSTGQVPCSYSSCAASRAPVGHPRCVRKARGRGVGNSPGGLEAARVGGVRVVDDAVGPARRGRSVPCPPPMYHRRVPSRSRPPVGGRGRARRSGTAPAAPRCSRRSDSPCRCAPPAARAAPRASSSLRRVSSFSRTSSSLRARSHSSRVPTCAGSCHDYAPVAIPHDLDSLTALLSGAGFVRRGREAEELLARADGDAELLESLVERRLTGEAARLITGSVTFCGLQIRVDSRRLRPTWQSEPLARRASERLPADGTAIDLCTGAERSPGSWHAAPRGPASGVRRRRARRSPARRPGRRRGRRRLEGQVFASAAAGRAWVRRARTPNDDVDDVPRARAAAVRADRSRPRRRWPSAQAIARLVDSDATTRAAGCRPCSGPGDRSAPGAEVDRRTVGGQALGTRAARAARSAQRGDVDAGIDADLAGRRKVTLPVIQASGSSPAGGARRAIRAARIGRPRAREAPRPPRPRRRTRRREQLRSASRGRAGSPRAHNREQ